MRHNLKQIAKNERLPLRGFIEFALAHQDQYAIEQVNETVTTGTFWSDQLVRDFRAEYLPRIGDTFFDTTKTTKDKLLKALTTGTIFRINSFMKYNGEQGIRISDSEVFPMGLHSYTYCKYEEATHITGYGVCGWFGKKEDIQVIGNVPDDLYERLLKEFEQRIGKTLTV